MEQPVGRSEIAVSAVICTRNRPDKIRTAVENVLANEHDSFTLTVVDQSTDNATRSIVEEIARSDDRLRYEHVEEVGLSRAYNRGIALTDGPILAFTDDDCVAPTDWISSIEEAFSSDPDADLLYGQVIPLEHASDESYLTPNLVFDQAERLGKGSGFRVFGMGANFAARRRLFDHIGGFDEVLGGGGPLKSSQDYDLAYRTYRANHIIVLRPEVVIRHDGRREPDEWPTLLANYGFGDGAFYTKHVRCRDAYATGLFAKQIATTTAKHVVHRIRRRHSDPSYLIGLYRGCRSSFKFALDAEARLYKSAEKEHAVAGDT